jgi:hypothetical protein
VVPRRLSPTGRGEYEFDERFGLWLCKDFVPILQRNDLLLSALARATEKVKKRLRFDLSRTRFWQVFINHQALVLTANRNGMANVRDHEEKIVNIVADHIATALKEDSFREWLENLQQSVVHGRRSKEIDAMNERVESVTQFFKKSGSDVDPTKIDGLDLLADDTSLRLPKPQNEQEVFHLGLTVWESPLLDLAYRVHAATAQLLVVLGQVTHLKHMPKANGIGRAVMDDHVERQGKHVLRVRQEVEEALGAFATHFNEQNFAELFVARPRLQAVIDILLEARDVLLPGQIRDSSQSEAWIEQLQVAVPALAGW